MSQDFKPVPDDIVRKCAAPIFERFPPDDLWSRSTAVAADVVGNFLLRPWFDRALASPFWDLEVGCRFQIRMVDLAESLLNLQFCPGFGTKLLDLRKMQAEDTFGEVEGVRGIYLQGWKVEFVSPTGNKRADYDLSVTLPDGTVAAVELKCKLEETPLSQASIANSLKAARQQLPKDKPGVVVLRLPRQWMMADSIDEPLKLATAAALRNSRRISAILLHWEVYSNDPNARGRLDVFSWIVNNNATHVLENVRTLPPSSPAAKWRQLDDIFPELSGALTRFNLARAGDGSK